MTAPFVVWAFELPADQSIATSTAKIHADRFIGAFPRAKNFVASFVLHDNIRPPASADNARCFRAAQELVESNRLQEENVERKIINPWKWQDALGFVQANEVIGGQRVLYCAGQISVDTDGKPMHVGDIGAQLKRALENLEQVLSAAGFSLPDVVRLNIYTTDVEGFFANRNVFVH